MLTGPLGSLSYLLSSETARCIRKLELPMSLLRAAAAVLCRDLEAKRLTTDTELLAQLSEKLNALADDMYVWLRCLYIISFLYWLFTMQVVPMR